MKEVFPIIPAGNGPLWVLIVLGVVLVGLLVLFGWFVYSSRNTRFEVSPDGLAIRGAMYGRWIALSDLDLERARTLDLERDKEYRFQWRTNGVGLPGYQAGWFKLKGGGKVLAFLTDRRRVACVPTRQGYQVMLSVSDPAAFLKSLRRAAGRP